MLSTSRGVLLAVALVASGCGGGGESSDGADPGPEATTTVPPGAGDADGSSSPSTTVAPTTVTPTTTTTLPPGDGTAANPFAYDAPAAVTMVLLEDRPEDEVFFSDGRLGGSVWNVTVGAPFDATETVLGNTTEDWNVPPPDGVVYAGFDASMTLASASEEPLSQDFDFRWRIIGGATGQAYSEVTIDTLRSGCGFLPTAFGGVVYVGGTMSGVVCIPLPREDLDHPDTRIELDQWTDVGTIFGPTGGAGVVAEIVQSGAVGTSTGEGTRAAPYALETAVDVAARSDAEVTLSVGPARDITDAVLAADPMNHSPADGILYVGYDVELTLAAAPQAYPPVALVTWGFAGGADHRRYFYDSFTPTVFGGPSDPDAPYDWGCGVVPDAIDDLTDLGVGETVSGVVCMPLPSDEFAHPDTQIAVHIASFGDIYFG